jgi:hypothetical protein
MGDIRRLRREMRQVGLKVEVAACIVVDKGDGGPSMAAAE